MNCYLCGTELIVENASKEHILLNAIGGRLKSKKLLCKTCNPEFGHQSDKELAKQLSFFSSFLCIKRDRGENQIIKGAQTKDGEIYNIVDGMKPVLPKPQFSKTVEEDTINYLISTSTEKELIKILEGLKRKHPELNLDLIKQHYEWYEEYLSEPLSVNISISGALALKSIAKSAINYYIDTQNEKNEVKHLFNYLKGMEELQIAKQFYPSNPIYKQEESEIIHLIHLVGERSSRLLYCFIELFSSFSFTILLSNNFQGDDFTSTYCYDLLQNKVLDKKVSINLSKEELEKVDLMTEKDFEIIQRKIGRIIEIGQNSHIDREISNICQNEIEEIYNKKYKGETIVTEQMISDFSNEIALAFTKFAYRESK